MAATACDTRGVDGQTPKRRCVVLAAEKSPAEVDHKNKEERNLRKKPLDKTLALYAARADKGAKKGEARRKNYFQVLDQYQTTVIGGATTVGGATAIHDREDEEFAEKINQEMMHFLQDEKLVQTRFEYAKKLHSFRNKFKKIPNKLKNQLDEYCRLEEMIGEDMMNVLSKTENLDGTEDFKLKDAPTCKAQPLKRADDPAYELQWM